MNPLVRLHNLSVTFSPRPSAYRARRAYFAAVVEAGETVEHMEGRGGRSATSRARLLGSLAALHKDMAGHAGTSGWHADAEVHEVEAELLWLLSSTEVAAGPYARKAGPNDWEAAFGPALDALTGETEPGRRAELMTRLYIDAQPVLGEVAETITVLRTVYVRLALTARSNQQEVTA